jgi:hypothetical protein
MAMDIEVIWVGSEAEYFCKRDWTTQIGLIRLNKFQFTSNAERPVRACFQQWLRPSRRGEDASPPDEVLLGFCGLGFMAYRRKSKPALIAA